MFWGRNGHTFNCINLGFEPTTFHQEHNDYELLEIFEPTAFQFPAQSFNHDPNQLAIDTAI